MRILLLCLLLFPGLAFAALCTPGDQLNISHGRLYFGATELSADKSPRILKPSPACKKLFPFCSLSPAFAKTKKKVFYRDKEIKGADPASFEYVCDEFAKDKFKIYKKNKVFSRSDAKNFKINTQLGVYMTKHRVYNREGRELPGADPKTLTKIQYKKKQLIDYVMDKSAVYSVWGVRLKLNPKKLTTFGLEYLGDDKRVYFRTKTIAGADPATFKVLDPESHTAEDKNNIYVEDKVKKKKISTENVTEPLQEPVTAPPTE